MSLAVAVDPDSVYGTLAKAWCALEHYAVERIRMNVLDVVRNAVSPECVGSERGPVARWMGHIAGLTGKG